MSCLHTTDTVCFIHVQRIVFFQFIINASDNEQQTREEMFCLISKVVVVRWISVVDILDNLRGIGEMSHEPSPALNKHRIVTVLIFMDFFQI